MSMMFMQRTSGAQGDLVANVGSPCAEGVLPAKVTYVSLVNNARVISYTSQHVADTTERTKSFDERVLCVRLNDCRVMRKILRYISVQECCN
jgi:hypothetical protein